ncbi:MAG: hypothetical protein ACM3RX_00700 [Methanococcaceae archaeon]
MKIDFLFLFLLTLLLTTLIPKTFSQSAEYKLKALSDNADVIAVGNISSQVSGWNSDKSRIFTEATLKISEILKGDNNGGKVVITYPGGEIDGVGEIYTHMPKFEKNEDVLVFLKKDNKGYKVYDGEDGKIKIITDSKSGQKMTTSNVRLESLKKQIKEYLNK